MTLEAISGSRSRFPIALIISIRSHFMYQRATSFLAILAFASSVALVIASLSASHSVRIALRTTADALAGASEIEIAGGEAGIPESLLDGVRSLEGVAAASPMIRETFVISKGPGADSSIRVLGVDLLQDRSVRSFRILDGGLQVQDPLRLITQLDSIVLSRALAERLELREGEALFVRSAGRELRLVVRAILDRGGLAEAWGGHVAIMDIYALQSLLGREGWIDRIDVVLADRSQRSELIEELRQLVAGRAVVSDGILRDGFVDVAMGALNASILAMVIVGVLVAGMLSYASISLFVDRRIREFALLGAVGLEQGRIGRLILTDSLVLAVLGTLLGAAVGVPLAQLIMSSLSAISEHLQDVPVPRLDLDGWTLVLGVGVGIGIALLGCLAPAWRVSSRDPIDVLKSPRVRDEAPRSIWMLAIGPVVGSLAVAVWTLGEGVAPIPRAGLSLAIGGLAVGLIATTMGPGLVRSLRPLSRLLFGRLGFLIGSYVEARPLEAGIAIAATALVAAAIVMSLVTISTIAVSVDRSISGLFAGGYRVMASVPISRSSLEMIPTWAVEEIASTPGVVAVAEYFNSTIDFRGEQVHFGTVTASALARHGNPAALMDADAIDGLLAGDLVMSSGFSKHFGVRRGDRIELPTPLGRRSFRVAGYFIDFNDEAGSLHIDTETYDRIWPRSGVGVLSIWIDGSAEQILAEVRRRVGDSYVLFITSGEDMAHMAEARFRRFAALLYLLAGVMGVLAGAAMVNLLAGSIAARRRELSLLRASGATPKIVVALVLLDAGVVAVVGCAAGLFAGLLASALIRAAIVDALGWNLVFSADVATIVAALTVVAAGSVVIALYPAWLGSRRASDTMHVG